LISFSSWGFNYFEVDWVIGFFGDSWDFSINAFLMLGVFLLIGLFGMSFDNRPGIDKKRKSLINGSNI
jgi:hypothetical protein